MDQLASPFLNSRLNITHQRNHLPHWQQELCFQFVTWHLGDALPIKAHRTLVREREIWLSAHPEPWSDPAAEEYHRLFSDRVDDWLDAGTGSAILRNPDLSQLVLDALLHFEGTRYLMDTLSIMPTHVHVLFQPLADHTLGAIVHSWKSFTAKRLNKQLGQTGPVWMKDYWDRLIRSSEHYWKTRRYILANPEKARLAKGQYRIWERPTPLLVELEHSQR